MQLRISRDKSELLIDQVSEGLLEEENDRSLLTLFLSYVSHQEVSLLP